MVPGSALFYYDKHGIQHHALLVKYYQPEAGREAEGEKKAVAPSPERVDLVFVTSKGNTVTAKDVVRRGPERDSDCFKAKV